MRLERDTLLRSEVRLYGAAALAPIQTAKELGLPGWLAAFVGGLVSVLTYDIVIPGLVLAVAAGAVDYLLGWHRARREGRDRADLAHAGLFGKGAHVFLALSIRFSEWWLHHFEVIPDTRGFFGAAAAVAILVAEWRSINKHLRLMGKGNSLVGVVIEALVALAQRRLPDPARERRDDERLA